MKTLPPIQRQRASNHHRSLSRYQLSTINHQLSSRAFTLVEMIIVIAIMALLAAMIFPVAGHVKSLRLRKTAQAELTKVETAIESYHAKRGHYPPDNGTAEVPRRYVYTPLYYELLGTRLLNGNAAYETLDGGAKVPNNPTTFTAFFGTTTGGDPSVSGFINCTRGGGGDEGHPATKFLKDLKAGQFVGIPASGETTYLLGAAVDGPLVYEDNSGRKINPWRYNSSSPTNNPNSFDLWIDIKIGSKTHRISNWSKTAVIVP